MSPWTVTVSCFKLFMAVFLAIIGIVQYSVLFLLFKLLQGFEFHLSELDNQVIIKNCFMTY